MSEKKVRSRFAPSPTGYMHIGNLRTALYTYLIAKKDDGDFILRIEDTDQERLVEGSVEVIYKTLEETGLIWDEGPDKGGPVGPYVQSERKDLYKKHALNLIEKEKAYYCFCDKERLDEVRKIQMASGAIPKYDEHCRGLDLKEAQSRADAGEKFVIRQKIPKDKGATVFHDEIYGDIEVDNEVLDDQVLLKRDGLPTYNFANVVDDHLMGITHVVRGNEYLSSAPKYNLLYEAFGWEVPLYVHCSPVMKNQKEKLSKRDGDASYQDLVAAGYLTPAILNYIALLGWSPKGEQEIFSLDELKEVFEIKGISKSPAIFDSAKLSHINGEYIRKMTPEEFHSHALPWILKGLVKKDVDTLFLAEILQSRTDVLKDIPEQIDFIDKMPEYSIDMYNQKRMKSTPETALVSLKEVLAIMNDTSDADFTKDILGDKFKECAEKMDIKIGLILWPVRVALSGKQFTPGGGTDLAVLLKKEESEKRISAAIAKLEAEI